MDHLLLNQLTMWVNFVAVGFDDGLQELLLAFDFYNHCHLVSLENEMEGVQSLNESIHRKHPMNIRNAEH